jgi:hypothetical protein
MRVTHFFSPFTEEYLAKIVKEKKENPLSTANDESKPASNDKPNLSANNQQQSASSTSIQSTSSSLASSSSSSHPPPTITTDQTSLMMNLYNTFFNQYMQQYQQQKPPEPPTIGSTDEQNYEYLTNQAAFYAKQHQTIQTQLESCLTSTAQQFMNELASVKNPSNSVTLPPATIPSSTQGLIQQNMYYTPYGTK